MKQDYDPEFADDDTDVNEHAAALGEIIEELRTKIVLRDQEIQALKQGAKHLQSVLSQNHRDINRLRGQKGEARRNARYLACWINRSWHAALNQIGLDVVCMPQADEHVMKQVLDTYPSATFSGRYLDGSEIPTDEYFERLGKSAKAEL